MSDNYYRFFVGDYLRDTGDLSLIEHGAYHILLHHYYMQEWLPAERQKLYRICRAFSDDERKAIDTVVDRYFTENGDGRIKNRKAEEEIAERKAFTEAQSARGKAGATARWGAKDKADDIAQALQAPLPKHKHKNGLPSPSPILEERDKDKSRKPSVKTETIPHLGQTKITEEIKTRCLTINSLPQKQNPFNVYQWTKWAINKKYHPEAILVVLDNLITYWDSTKDPWSYASKIISIKSGNYYERDGNKSEEKYKADFMGLINDLKALRIFQQNE